MTTEEMQAHIADPLPIAEPTRGAITWRSVAIGTLMVALVCGISPYNDYVVGNTMMIGLYLPVLLVILMFGLVIFINGPLHRFAPRHALNTGELGVIMAMTLVSCGLPGQGMMRTLIPTLISPFHHGLADQPFWKNFLSMNLPEWLFPVGKLADGRQSDVMRWFYSPPANWSLLPAGSSPPYMAWVVPLLGWGVFIFAMIATMLALATIITPQWAVNERLAFPIAQIEQALIEPPEKGRALNELFRNRLFWVATISVIIIQSLVTMRLYYPKYIPKIPLSYDLRAIFTEEPWTYFNDAVKAARVYFMFIGITYFISSRVSFSIWSSFLITELVTVQQRMMQSDMPAAAWSDQHLGASVAVLIGVIWIGRQHWFKVIRQATSVRPDPNLPKYRIAFFTSILGPIVMTGWLMAVGVQLWMAILLVAFVMLGHIVVARIVAETGLAFIRVMISPFQVVTNLPTSILRANDVFFSGVFTMNGALDTRESIFAFMVHGLRVNEDAAKPKKSNRGLIALMMWAAVFGFAVAAASSLYCYYHYSLQLGESDLPMINQWAMQNWPKAILAEPVNQWADGHFPPKAYNPWMHMSIGVGLTGVLQAATLRWAWWPFLPVGYLVSTTWYVQLSWLSIFIGWLAKLLIVKFGGARLYQKAKPIFFGLVFGDALAAGLWALINLGLAMSGSNFKVVLLLPN